MNFQLLFRIFTFNKGIQDILFLSHFCEQFSISRKERNGDTNKMAGDPSAAAVCRIVIARVKNIHQLIDQSKFFHFFISTKYL